MRLDRLFDDFKSAVPNCLADPCIVFNESRKGSFKGFSGGRKAVVRPDPIPNSAVKRSVADGSACIACARVGSRQLIS